MSHDLENYVELDLERPSRVGMIEAVYGEGKTDEQVCAILERVLERHGRALATRVRPETARYVLERLPELSHDSQARVLWKRDEDKAPIGRVAIVGAGTSDLPVMCEAERTLAVLGSAFERIVDVGVAGLHRLLPHLERLRSANAVIVVAGMEGALPSVVGGLIDRPLIAVPTSVGYGTSFGGITALLAMLNSCAQGVSVVNVDNGFGAACAAHRINALVAERP